MLTPLNLTSMLWTEASRGTKLMPKIPRDLIWTVFGIVPLLTRISSWPSPACRASTKNEKLENNFHLFIPVAPQNALTFSCKGIIDNPSKPFHACGHHYQLQSNYIQHLTTPHIFIAIMPTNCWESSRLKPISLQLQRNHRQPLATSPIFIATMSTHSWESSRVLNHAVST